MTPGEALALAAEANEGTTSLRFDFRAFIERTLGPERNMPALAFSRCGARGFKLPDYQRPVRRIYEIDGAEQQFFDSYVSRPADRVAYESRAKTTEPDSG